MAAQFVIDYCRENGITPEDLIGPDHHSAGYGLLACDGTILTNDRMGGWRLLPAQGRVGFQRKLAWWEHRTDVCCRAYDVFKAGRRNAVLARSGSTDRTWPACLGDEPALEDDAITVLEQQLSVCAKVVAALDDKLAGHIAADEAPAPCLPAVGDVTPERFERLVALVAVQAERDRECERRAAHAATAAEMSRQADRLAAREVQPAQLAALKATRAALAADAALGK